MQPSEEIKSKLNIVDVIREYIPLQAAGVNFRAKCPFHRENSPSFVVSPEKQIFHCFGCGEGGDVFGFVMKMEGVDFIDALRSLAIRAGVVLKRENPELNSKRNKLLDIMDLSRRFYHSLLLSADEAADARDYLKKRGLTAETIEEWQIGYSPDAWDRIIGFLKSKGYKEDEIFSAGLSVKSEKSNRFYDRFRGRIMFPINDANGATVGFSARVSPEKEASDKMGKYINSPQTLVYDKGKLLFGLDKARLEIKKNDLAILVEGQMDAISVFQAGYKNVIASSGTALSKDQVQLLKRFSGNIALSFDMDAAGEMAAERGMREAMEADMNIRVIELLSGKDPDECIRKCPADWEKAVRDAKPMMEYYFSKVFRNLDMKRVENKREAVRALLPTIMKIKNPIEKDFWLKRLAENVDVAVSVIMDSIVPEKVLANKKNIEQKSAQGQPAEAPKRIGREEELSELFLALIIKFDIYLEYAFNSLPMERLAGESSRDIYKNLIIYYNINNRNNIESSSFLGQQIKESKRFSVQEFCEWLKGEVFDFQSNEISDSGDFSSKNIGNQLKLFNKLEIIGEEEYAGMDEATAKIRLIKLIIRIKKNYLNSKMKEAVKKIAVAEKEGDRQNLKRAMQDFKEMSDEFRSLE